MDILNFKAPLILGSKSPRRKELLSLITSDFIVKTSEVDESLASRKEAETLVCELAQKKAEAIWKHENLDDQKDSLLLCADTLVSVGQDILGKPKSAQESKEMLQSLSGKDHFVTTGVTLKDRNNTQTFFVTTQIIFRALSEKEINLYIQTKEPQDKAGAYAIQGSAASFVEKINGSYTNVVGLPLSETFEKLSQHPFRR